MIMELHVRVIVVSSNSIGLIAIDDYVDVYIYVTKMHVIEQIFFSRQERIFSSYLHC